MLKIFLTETDFFCVMRIHKHKLLLCVCLLSGNILRKTIEGYQNNFDFVTFEKIISNQSIFVSDRTTNMQISEMQNAIYGSLVTIQYHAKCNNPLYQKVKSNKFCFYIFCCKLDLVISQFLTPTTDKVSHPFISHET